MTALNTQTTWGWVQRSIHWFAALVILFQLAMGFYMVNFLNDLERFGEVQTHKSWGFVAFILIAVRIIWRAMNPTPEEPAMPDWQRTASRGSHIALYALMVILPLTGWLMVTASPLNDPDAYPFQVKNMVFGLFEMPDLFATGDRDLTGIFATVHAYAAFGIAVLLALHVAAALKHQFVDRDGLLSRMVSGRPMSEEASDGSEASDLKRSEV
ncbi:MAG: cytochrome b [Pseudomonadota bacterium]